MGSTHLLVGRNIELETLRRLAGEAAGGRGSVLLLGGEAGIGKSALLSRAAAGAAPLLQVTTRCPGPGETPPFGPWLEAVGLLEHLTGRPSATLPPPFGEAAGHWEAAPLAASLASWLGAGPILLAIEDIHWADPASLGLLQRMPALLVRCPVLLVATYRTGELHPGHPLWALLPELQRAGADRLLLDRLTPQEVAELAGALYPDHPALRQEAVRLHRRTGGNPLFACEMLAHAAQSGSRLDRDEGLPETVQQAIDANLSRLAPATLPLLQAAAVIGERFTYDLLARVAGVQEDELDTALEEALSRQLIRVDGDGGDRFAFGHALVREFLISRLIGARRRRWHLRVAEALLAAPVHDLGLVAMHLSRCGDPRAVSYLTAAGTRALHMGAVLQAQDHYRAALHLTSAGDPRRSELLLLLGQACVYTDLREALAVWEEAVRQARIAVDLPAEAWGGHFLAIWQPLQESGKTLAGMHRVLELHQSLLTDPRFLALEESLFGRVGGFVRIAMNYARALVLGGRLAHARAMSAEIQGRSLPGPLQGLALGIEAFLAFYTGEPETALRLAARIIAAGQAMRYDRVVFSWMHFSHVLLGFYQADRPAELDAATARLVTFHREMMERSGMDPDSLPVAPLGWHQFLRGDWEGARHNLLPDEASRPDEGRLLLVWMSALLQVESGDLAGATATMASLPPREPETAPALDVVQVLPHCLRVRLELERGRPDRARAWLEAADRALSERTLLPYRPFVQAAWAEYWVRTGDPARAEASARELLKDAEGLRDQPHVIRAQRLLGRLDARQGRRSEAEARFAEALRLAEMCQAPYELALTQLEVASSLPDAPGAGPALAAAREAFARLGARPALDAADACLRLRAEVSVAAEQWARPEVQVTVQTQTQTQVQFQVQGQVQAVPGPLGSLTERELAVLRLVARGLVNKEIGAELNISGRTVGGHLQNIFGKLQVSTRSAVAAIAVQHGLMESTPYH